MTSAPLVLTGEQAATLGPGNYWIEIEFDRPVDREAVLGALEKMGFTDVLLDADTESSGLTSIGAPTRARTTSSVNRTPSPAPFSRPISDAIKSPVRRVTATSLPAAPAHTSPFRKATAQTFAPSPPSRFSLGTPKPGGGDSGDASASADGPGGGGGDFADASSAPSDDPSYADIPPPALETAIGPDEVFGNHPETAITVDAIGLLSGAASPFVFRFVAKLPHAVILKNGAGWWKAIREIHLDPWEQPSFTFKPFIVEEGKIYEARILSRDRTARARGDVVTLLEAMGFLPGQALVLKRNERVPGRPGTSVSEWLILGQWKARTSMITAEEPFWFLDMKRISP